LWVDRELAKDQLVHILLDGNLAPVLRNNFDFAARIGNLEIQNTLGAQIVLRDRSIESLIIGVQSDVKLVRCRVRRLQIENVCTLEMEDTFVGDMVRNNLISRWGMSGGSVLKLLTLGNRRHAFGTVEFNHVYFPHDPSEIEVDPQGYRDARQDLLARNNVLAAAVFHSAELALDRRRERFANRFVSWIYELLSDYGNSIARPLVWFFVIILIVGAISAMFDLTMIGVPPHELVGWQMILCDPSWIGDVARSVTYALRAVVNPLNIFRTEPLVVSRSPLAAFGLTVLSLFGTLSLGLIVIGIRRRFKLE
jgi:hypothetical protein